MSLLGVLTYLVCALALATGASVCASACTNGAASECRLMAVATACLLTAGGVVDQGLALYRWRENRATRTAAAGTGQPIPRPTSLAAARRLIRPSASSKAAVTDATTRPAADVERPAEVYVLTFSDKRHNLYLHTLAATVLHFGSGAAPRPLHVLGLSGARAPDPRRAGKWAQLERRAIKGTDPGKLKKVWFLGALLSRDAPLGMRPHDLLLFVDAFDVLVQRPLAELPAAYEALRKRRRLPTDAVVTLGEHNCWPWPQGEAAVGRKRTRGLSMDYMANATVEVRGIGAGGGGGGGEASADEPTTELASSRLLPATRVCAELRRRSGRGRWLHPNAGAFVTTLRGARSMLEQLRGLAQQGHFEDQAMLGLALLQQPHGAIAVDVNASLFSSQYAYNGNLWERPACFADYFDRHGNPPPQRSSGAAPFAMHFNGPAGRYRLGWCVAVLQHRTRQAAAASAQQYLVDIDADEARVPLPRYCGGVLNGSIGRHRTAVPPRPVPPPLPCTTQDQVPLACANDHCFVP